MPPVPSAPKPTPRTTGSRGCLVALIAATGVLLLACLGLSAVLWRVKDEPKVRDAVRTFARGRGVLTRAAKAPGVKALRRLGCFTASVLTPEDFAELRQAYGRDGGGPWNSQVTQVSCQGMPLGKVPTCRAVAEAYVAEAHPELPFLVTVIQSSNLKPHCQERFEPDGAPSE